ncbi:MAG: HpcH/HpaI aldolase family protein [Bacilli bacterium]
MNFRKLVKDRAQLCGTHVSLTDPAISEIFGAVGFDYLWIDMEHTELTPEIVHRHIMAAKSQGTPCLVRVPVHDLTNTKRLLEIGPDAIVFPMVQNYEDAKELLSWTLYPPFGKRGCGPRNAVRYGLDDEVYYRNQGHIEKMARLVMIETQTAVDDIEKIASLAYLDGVIVGMFDLSGSINQLGNIYCEKNIEMLKKVIASCKKHKISCGISLTASDTETIKFFYDLGVNMISVGADTDWLGRGAKVARENLRKIQGK